MSNERNIQTMDATISHELEDVEQQLNTLREKLDVPPDYTRGVADPRMTSWDLDRALMERLEKRATSLRDALQNLENGEYGLCASCGKAINPERLAIMPDAKLCIECARKA